MLIGGFTGADDSEATLRHLTRLTQNHQVLSASRVHFPFGLFSNSISRSEMEAVKQILPQALQ